MSRASVDGRRQNMIQMLTCNAIVSAGVSVSGAFEHFESVSSFVGQTRRGRRGLSTSPFCTRVYSPFSVTCRVCEKEGMRCGWFHPAEGIGYKSM
jgi:hypothetical protein